MEVAGAVVGVISLGIQATQSLTQYYTSVRDQNTDTARTISKLNFLLQSLRCLEENINNRVFQPEEQTIRQTIESAVRECEKYIDKLSGEAKALTGAPAPTPKPLQRSASSNIEAFARNAVRRVTYPFHLDTLRKLDKTIDEISDGLSFALQIIQQKDTTTIQYDIGDTKGLVNQIKISQTTIRDDLEDTKAVLKLIRNSQISHELRSWPGLKAPDVSVNYSEACKKRHPETGHWFVKDGVEFTRWLSEPNSFLWLNGFAGSGKSVLSSTAIQWTEAYRQRMSFGPVTSGLAFFYFTFNDESKQDTTAMLRSVILQLASQAEKKGEEHLIRLKEVFQDATPPNDALLETLHALIEEFDDIYLILDALDESPKQRHRETLLDTLQEIREWSEPRLHLLVTSRDEQDIRECLSPSEGEEVKMKNASIDSDIASFITGHLQTNKRLRRWSKHHQEIQEALASRAQGVFRWVECQLKALESCPISKTRLTNLLASLPRNLDDTYERMLLKIDEDSVEDARKVLTLLCTATRPLTISELIEAIAVELDPPNFNRDSLFAGEEDILYICPGLLEFDKENNVRIAHYSVQEYLESDRISKSKASRYFVESRAANTEVASICLTYMLDPDISELVEKIYTRKSIPSSDGSDMPLMYYAAENWKTHYRAANQANDCLHGLMMSMFCNRENKCSLQVFLRYLTTARSSSSGPSKSPIFNPIRSPIVAASEDGFDTVLHDLLHKCPGVDKTTESMTAALRQATFNDRVSTTKQLIEHGVDVDSVYELRTTALYWAIDKSFVDMVQLLLEKGSDPNRIYGRSRLYLPDEEEMMAAEDLSNWYCEEDFDIEVVAPLTVAAWIGNERVVELLLDHGADPGLGQPLGAAVYQKNEKVVQLFHRRGIRST
ncbi:ankyrin repeat, PH and SEC7 domain-containing protein secG [Cercophora samala]|uniref:Ankyrin repeat, PH and SEC7 domain-containing protein secG n=1 Tax=Cercophora samala TaxID=330535 RepID=A0AA39Z4V0_9PEZI|nr:ankyrin repeat, PH and SEC7 domain-containing protein secG [Cercophora samala]